MGKKIIIIGAGLAGLSAGIYLQRSGFDTEIYEMAPWAGGVCTAWTRKGYRFDGCIHWMVGTQPGNAFYQEYLEVGALTPDTPIYNTERIQIEANGEIISLPLHLEPFLAALKEQAPEDSVRIDAFGRDLSRIIHSKLPIGAPGDLKGWINLFTQSGGWLRVAGKYTGTTVAEYFKDLHSQRLKTLIGRLMPDDFSVTALFMMLSSRMSDNAGYPLGGASGVIERMLANYKSAGGIVHLNAPVERIIVDGERAQAVVCSGETIPADGVIAAGDGHNLLTGLLDGRYRHPQLDEMLKSAPLFSPLALVSYGLNRRFNIPFSLSCETSQGIPVAPGVSQHQFSLRSFDFDPSAAPEGGSAVMVILSAPLDDWLDLRSSDKAAYQARKDALAAGLADAIETRYPGFRDAIVVTDVSTPATYVRLCNLYQASFEGFLPTPAALKTIISQTLPGIQNLTLCGQWTTPGGGICSAVHSGKMAAGIAAKQLR